MARLTATSNIVILKKARLAANIVIFFLSQKCMIE